MRRFPGVVFATAFLFLSMSFSNAVAWDEYWPGANYDPSIPTIENVLGHESGERITWHSEAIRYFDALAAAGHRPAAIRSLGQLYLLSARRGCRVVRRPKQ